jgi:hypothetical protein
MWAWCNSTVGGVSPGQCLDIESRAQTVKGGIRIAEVGFAP